MVTEFTAVYQYDAEMKDLYNDICKIPIYGPINTDLFDEKFAKIRENLMEYSNIAHAVMTFHEPRVVAYDRKRMEDIWVKGFIESRAADILLDDYYLINKHGRLEYNTRFLDLWMKLTRDINRAIERCKK